jgi:hypothetical protein
MNAISIKRLPEKPQGKKIVHSKYNFAALTLQTNGGCLTPHKWLLFVERIMQLPDA